MSSDNGSHTFNATLYTTGSQSLTATDTVSSSVTGAQTGIQVTQTASSLVLAGFPSPATAGTASSFTVTVKDFLGNTVPGYRGTINFTSSDPQAVLPANYTFTSSDNGSHTFSATLNTVGTQSLTATDMVTSSVTGAQMGIMVKAGSNQTASNLLVAGFPSPATTGVPGSFTVTARDSGGNTVAGYTGKVHFTSSDPAAVLPADYTFTSSDNGSHTFTATLNTLGTQLLTATDSATSSVTGSQTGIQVNPSGGTTLTVNSTADNTTADNVLTLREALALENGTLGRQLTAGEQAQVYGALGNNDTIRFSLPSGPQTITLTGGALSVLHPVTIAGPGAANLTISANNQSRVIVVGTDWSPNLSLVASIGGLTIANGSAVSGSANYGGGLLNFGTLSVANITFANNAAGSSGGGGVYNVGALTLTGCTFSGNTVLNGGHGGALQNNSAGTVTVNGCTITGNQAAGSGSSASTGAGLSNSGTMNVSGSTFTGNSAASSGGAIYNNGTLTVDSSTFANNSSQSSGGAIRSGSTLTVTRSTFAGNSGTTGGALNSSDGTLNVTNCTFANNTAASLGGAVYFSGGSATLNNNTITANRVASGSSSKLGGGMACAKAVLVNNTIIAGNFQGPVGTTTASDINGNVAGGSSYNLIGIGGNGGLSDGKNGNQVGVSDAGLGALADNGGPTQTIALLAGSAAIDHGNNNFVTAGETDQRGLARIKNGTVDIGAFEF
jgi:predicted outer membrane repeat protein